MKLSTDRQTTLVRFAVSGALAAAIYYAVAWLAIRQFGWKPLTAGLAGYVAALPMAYWLHRKFTFQSRARVLPESSRFVASSIIGIVLSSVLPAIMSRFEVSLAIALAATCVLVPAANYLLLSRWTFSRAEHHG